MGFGLAFAFWAALVFLFDVDWFPAIIAVVVIAFIFYGGFSSEVEIKTEQAVEQVTEKIKEVVDKQDTAQQPTSVAKDSKLERIEKKEEVSESAPVEQEVDRTNYKPEPITNFGYVDTQYIDESNRSSKFAEVTEMNGTIMACVASVCFDNPTIMNHSDGVMYACGDEMCYKVK